MTPMHQRDADIEAELEMLAKLESKTSPVQKIKDGLLLKQTEAQNHDSTLMPVVSQKNARSAFTVAQLLDSKTKKNKVNNVVNNHQIKDVKSISPSSKVKNCTKTNSGLKPQTVSALADFPRNSGAHLNNFMSKSMQSPPKMRHNAPHPITAPGFHLDLTQSVQRVMSAIPCVDALSPPLDPPTLSLPATPSASPSKRATPTLTPTCSPLSKAVLAHDSTPPPTLSSPIKLMKSLVTPLEVNTSKIIPEKLVAGKPTENASGAELAVSSAAAIVISEASPVSNGSTSLSSPDGSLVAIETSVVAVENPPILALETPVVLASYDTSEAPILTLEKPVCENPEISSDSQECPSLTLEVEADKNNLTRVKSEERMDSGIETSSTGTPSSSETSSVASMHMQEASSQDGSPLHGTASRSELPSSTTASGGKEEEPTPRLGLMTRRASRSSTDSRSGSTESLRSHNDHLPVAVGPRRRLRSDGSDMSTDTTDSGRGTRCSVSADRTSTPSPTPRHCHSTRGSTRKRQSPEEEATPVVPPPAAEEAVHSTRGSKRKLVMEEEVQPVPEKRSRNLTARAEESRKQAAELRGRAKSPVTGKLHAITL